MADTPKNDDDAKKALEAEYDHAGSAGSPEDIASVESPSESPSEPPAIPKTPRKHPPSLVNMAIKFGASREAIDGATTGDLAEWIERQSIIRDRENEQSRRREVQPVPAAPSAPAEEAIDWGRDTDGNAISEADLNPAFVNIFKSQQKKIRQLEREAGEIRESDKVRQQTTVTERLDDAFAAIDKKYAAYFGTGGLGEITKAEHSRRNAILTHAGVDFKRLPSIRSLISKLEAAASEVFMVKAEPESDLPTYGKSPGQDDVPKMPNGKPRITQDQLDNGVLARVAARKSEPEKGRKAAAKAVSAKMQEIGWTDADFEKYEEDGMPE